jgi:hypothetical protein
MRRISNPRRLGLLNSAIPFLTISALVNCTKIPLYLLLLFSWLCSLLRFPLCFHHGESRGWVRRGIGG